MYRKWKPGKRLASFGRTSRLTVDQLHDVCDEWKRINLSEMTEAQQECSYAIFVAGLTVKEHAEQTQRSVSTIYGKISPTVEVARYLGLMR